MKVRPEPHLLETNRNFYDGLWSGASLVRPERFNTWPLVDELAARAPRRLEIGPGLRPRLPLADTHFVDISAPALEQLSAHGGHAVDAQVSELSFPDARFDLVCALDIVEHVEDDNAAVSEIARVAAPGAWVLMSVPLHPEYWTRFDDFVGHCRRYRPQELSSLLAAHGLEIEQSAAFGMKPQSSNLSRLGLWFLRHQRALALLTYNRLLMPLSLRRQQPLQFFPGMMETAGLDEIFMACRRRGGKSAQIAH